MKLIAAVFLAASLFYGDPGDTFTVGRFQALCVSGHCLIHAMGDPNHESITGAALWSYEVKVSDGSTIVNFDPEVIAVIQNKNAETDSLYWDLPPIHFDNESLGDGQAWLVALRQSIGDWARTGYYAHAQELLGRALHTVQDFYAHSTWVEQSPGRKDVAPLGRPACSSATSGRCGTLPPVPADSVATCSPNADQTIMDPLLNVVPKTGILTPVPFTTEWFDAGQELASNDFTWTTFQSIHSGNRCRHGLSDRNNNDSSGFGDGINKDATTRDFYAEAFNLATQASVQFVQDVIDDIKSGSDSKANDDAICGLLTGAACSSVSVTSASCGLTALSKTLTEVHFTGQGLAQGQIGRVIQMAPPLGLQPPGLVFGASTCTEWNGPPCQRPANAPQNTSWTWDFSFDTTSLTRDSNGHLIVPNTGYLAEVADKLGGSIFAIATAYPICKVVSDPFGP